MLLKCEELNDPATNMSICTSNPPRWYLALAQFTLATRALSPSICLATCGMARDAARPARPRAAIPRPTSTMTEAIAN